MRSSPDMDRCARAEIESPYLSPTSKRVLFLLILKPSFDEVVVSVI